MTESPTHSPQNATTSASNDNQTVPKIPIEIEAANAATRSSLSPTDQFEQNARSIQYSTTSPSKRRLPDWAETSSIGDIEDYGGGFESKCTPKKNRVTESWLTRFRRKSGLYVTDITSTEWCEKQMEFDLIFGKREITEPMKEDYARHTKLEEEEWFENKREFDLLPRRPVISEPMKAGYARHAQLEKEVLERVRVHVESDEDTWAIKFMDFIYGANQLLSYGLTRELRLIGFVEGVWMVGVIDEIRMPITGTEGNPTLVEIKTRKQKRIPLEPQQRNGRLQLMCYKYLWDNAVANNFSSRQFFDFFSLDPNNILSEDIREYTYPAETLGDIVTYFRDTCSMLPPSNDQLLIRYEWQEDNSLLCEDQFTYDSEWVKGQIQFNLEFWQGKREANYTPKEERWKCNYCKFAPKCPVNTNPEGAIDKGKAHE